MHLLCPHFVRYRRQSQAKPLTFGIGDHLQCAFDDEMDGHRLVWRQRAVDRWIDVEQLVAGFQAGGETQFDLGHGRSKGKSVARVLVFEPRPAMVQAGIERAVPCVLDGIAPHLADKLRGRPACVGARTVDLIERGGKEHGHMVARGGEHGRLQNRRRVGAGGKQTDLDVLLLAQGNDLLDDLVERQHMDSFTHWIAHSTLHDGCSGSRTRINADVRELRTFLSAFIRVYPRSIYSGRLVNWMTDVRLVGRSGSSPLAMER